MHYIGNADCSKGFGFWVGDMHYIIDLEHVLSIKADMNETRPIHGTGEGLLGVVDHHGTPVAVYDFAKYLGAKPTKDLRKDLYTCLKNTSVQHELWFETIKHQIEQQTPVSQSILSEIKSCSLESELEQFHTYNESLSSLIDALKAPYRRLHEGLSKLRHLSAEDSLNLLHKEILASMAEFRNLLERSSDTLMTIDRSILLFLSKDGQNPQIAFRIDEVEDVLNYSPSQLVPIDDCKLRLTDAQVQILKGLLRRSNPKESASQSLPLGSQDNVPKLAGQSVVSRAEFSLLVDPTRLTAQM